MDKAAEILLAIIHCNSCYFVFSLQFRPPWEVYVGNHRMVEVGRQLWRSACPTTLLNQGHLEAVAQVSVQTAFEYLQDGDSTTHNLSGQSVPVLGRPSQWSISSDIKSMLRAKVATIKLCSCEASHSDTRPCKLSKIMPLQLQPSSFCNLNSLRDKFIFLFTQTFWNFPCSVLPFFTLERLFPHTMFRTLHPVSHPCSKTP